MSRNSWLNAGSTSPTKPSGEHMALDEMVISGQGTRMDPPDRRKQRRDPRALALSMRAKAIARKLTRKWLKE